MSDISAAVSASARRFEVGACLSMTFAIFRRNLVPFLVLGLAIGIPGLIYSLVTEISALEAGSDATVSSSGGSIIDMFANALLAATVVYGTVQDLRGQPANFNAILSQGTSALGRVILASLLASLAILFAGLLLIVPGIIVALMLWVYIPAIVIERAGISQSFSRSRELTKGHRWAILGVAAIFFVGFAAAMLAVFMLLPEQLAGSALNTTIAQDVLIYIAGAIYGVLTAVASAVGYYLLRAEKEGVDIEEIAKVFD